MIAQEGRPGRFNLVLFESAIQFFAQLVDDSEHAFERCNRADAYVDLFWAGVDLGFAYGRHLNGCLSKQDVFARQAL